MRTIDRLCTLFLIVPVAGAVAFARPAHAQEKEQEPPEIAAAAHRLAEDFPRYAPPGPEEPVPQVFLEPVDMSSDVGESPIRVTLHVNQGGRVTEELLAQLPSQISLVEWPEMTEVPVTNQITREPEGTAIAAFVTVTPVRPLSDRWYALKVAKLPEDAAFPAFSPHKAPGEGEALTRFRVGSDPQVASVRICDKDGSKVLIIDFSERVQLADLKRIVTKYGDGALPGCGDWEAVGPGGTTSIVRRCQALEEARPLVVAIDRGALRSEALVRPIQLAVKELVPWGDGCRIFRP